MKRKRRQVKDGEVESVSVGGNEDYSSDAWYPNDVEVAVTYHTYPKKESEDISKEEETQNTEENKPTEESYSEINELIYQDLLLSQGWALGKLDPDGKPIENGTPSPTYAFSLYIENITYLGDKLRVSVFPEFKQLSEEDKTYVINTVQNMSINKAFDWFRLKHGFRYMHPIINGWVLFSCI